MDEPSPVAHRVFATRAGRRMLVVAGTSGLATALSFPPRRWWWTAVVGTASLVVLLRGRRPAQRAVLGGAFAFGMVITAFVTIWTAAVPVLVIVAEVLAAAVVAALFGAALVAVPSGRGIWIGFPSALVLLAAVQARWPFGGLPGVGIPFGQAGGPLDDVARLGGERAIVGVVALAGVAVAGLVLRSARVAGGATALTVAAVVAGHLAPAGGAVGEVEVAAVQGGGRRGVQATPYAENFALQHAATRRVEPPVDLVLLPEGTAHVRMEIERTPEARRLAGAARRLGADLVAGVVERAGDDHFHNSVVVWSPDGTMEARYDKRHAVPFAERVPARRVLERLLPIEDLVRRDMIEGDDPGLFVTGAGTWGVVVSFEVFFGRLVRDVVRGGAELVLVPTNASSFRDDTVPDFEVAAAQLRAVESGRFVVQAAPTGYSAVVSPSGRVVARSGLGEGAEVVQARVERRAGLTPYMRVGEWPLVLSALLAFAAAWLVDESRPRLRLPRR